MRLGTVRHERLLVCKRANLYVDMPLFVCFRKTETGERMEGSALLFLSFGLTASAF
jgi:hypothetical protein